MSKIISRIGQFPESYRFSDLRRHWDGFLRVFSFQVAGQKHRQEVMDRGSAVMVLPVDWQASRLYLVEQPRFNLAFQVVAAAADALMEARAVGSSSASVSVPSAAVNTLDVPAGGIEPDEAPEAAAIREIREETGLVITAADLTLVSDHYTSVGGSTERQLCYLAAVGPDTPRTVPEGDGDEVMATHEVSFAEAAQLLRDGRVRHASFAVLIREVLWRAAGSGPV